MPNPVSRATSRIKVDLAAWQIGSFFVFGGLVLLLLSAHWAGKDGPSWIDEAVREVGALLLVTGALSVVWDLRGRRALTREIMDAARLSSEITGAGLSRIAGHYLEIDWVEFLGGASHVDLFFAYARTWRASHATQLREFVGRDNSRLRVVLPDRTNELLMESLAAKFGYEPDDLKERIEDAERDFENLARQASGASVQVRHTGEFPLYTLYRADRRYVVVLYAQTKDRTNVPTFECEQGGALYTFFREQFDRMWDEAEPANS